MKVFKTAVLVFGALLLSSGVLALEAQENAAVQMAKPGIEITGGKVLSLEIKLDKPLPPETSVIARVKPESVSQLLVLSGSTPDDPARTKITVKTTLPNVLVPGRWVLSDVYIVLPGTNIWQPIAHNDLKFDVQGKPFPIPEKAEVSVAK
jgi:hypothetical protein